MAVNPAPLIGSITNNKKHLGKRDAFHVPGVLVKSKETVYPGDSIKFVDDECTCVSVADIERHGIVDPFLVGCAYPEQLFWVFIQPEIFSNLAHHFEIDLEVNNLPYTHVKREPEENDDEDSSCRGCY